MLNIVVPMAGIGIRFKNKGYLEPKPLIKIKGEPMIKIVINNLKPKCDHKFIFICQNEHLLKHNLKSVIESNTKNFGIIGVSKVTDGPASSVLLAKEYINNNNPLMIANCDQYIEEDINLFLSKSNNYDGYIMTMQASDPKWSFVKFDGNNNIVELVEKKVVSNVATVGIYNFKHGSLFCKYAKRMINEKLSINNEYYVAPVYNYMINDKLSIETFDITGKMHGLGTPEDLNLFLK